MAGDRAAVLSEARAALAEGKVLEALGLLEDRLAHESDPDALRLLGEARHRLGDLGGAGAVWFATNAKGPIIDEAIEAWRTEYDDDFAAMWASLPEGVRTGPLSPRLKALRDRAGVVPVVVPEGDATTGSTVIDDPHAPEWEPKGSAGAGAESESSRRTDPVGSRPQHSARPGQDADRSSRRVGKDADPESTDPEAADPVAVHPEATPTARRSERARSGDGGPESRARRGPADLEPAMRERRPAESEPSTSEGFDAAKVIAWVLAALFVVCAVVGLITILQWLVPGS